MSGKYNSWSRTEGGFDHANNIGHTQTTEEWPEEEILEAGGTRWEVVDEGIIFHVDSDEVVKTGRWEVEDSWDFFGMEEIGCFVPMLGWVSGGWGRGDTIHIALR